MKLKPWEHRIPANRESTRNRRRVLILCEDTKSSRFYFQRFPIDQERFTVETVGTGMNTDTLVEEAIRRKSAAENNREPYSEVWAVMDRDDFPLANYQRAFELAKVHGIRLAWSNEAFELWYLLHFNYCDTGISRSEYVKRLKSQLDYDKSDPKIYHRVLGFQDAAIRNAKRLERHWRDLGEKFPERQNPSTSVHKLVEFLNELAELDSV
jgi:hypothetical protein